MIKKIFIFCILISCLISVSAQTGKPEIGVVQDIENDSLLHVNGYHSFVESIAKLFSPKNVSETQFKRNLERIKKLNLELYAVNIFIPGELKLVGPEVDENAILSYVDTVFKRCSYAGVKMIIWGSSGARRVPDGFDRAKAKEQFTYIAKKISTRAKHYNIILALENLNKTETNFINTVEEAYEIVLRVNHPNFKLCIDIYHMSKEAEDPSIILKTKKHLVHCDIAEKQDRTPPGTNGDDFKPYLNALHKIGYNKKIVIESRWANLATQASPARIYLQNQIDEVYGK